MTPDNQPTPPAEPSRYNIMEAVEKYFATVTPEQLEADLKKSNFDLYQKYGQNIISPADLPRIVGSSTTPAVSVEDSRHSLPAEPSKEATACASEIIKLLGSAYSTDSSARIIDRHLAAATKELHETLTAIDDALGENVVDKLDETGRYSFRKTIVDAITELREKRDKRLAEAQELLREIRDNEVNASDEADKFLRDHQPSELSQVRAQLATARKDGERLDWLDKDTQQKIHAVQKEVAEQWQLKCDNHYQRLPSFRHAIDAAMQEEGAP